MRRITMLLALLILGAYGILLSSSSLRTPALLAVYTVYPVVAVLILWPVINVIHRQERNANPNDTIVKPGRTRFWILVGIFFILVLASLAAARIAGRRDSVYYLIVLASLAVVSIQVTAPMRPSRNKQLMILAETGFSLAAIVFCKYLTYPYYYGVMDSTTNGELVNLVVSSGHIQPAMGNYFYFPLSHTITAITMEAANGTSAIGWLHVVFAFSAFAMPFLIFKISRKLDFAVNQSMITCLLISHGALAIFFLSETMPQGLLFLLGLFLVNSWLSCSRNRLHSGLFLIFAMASILTHQVSVPLLIMGLGILAVILFARNGVTSTNKRRSEMVLTFALMYVSYSAIVALSFYGTVVLLRPIPLEGISILETARSMKTPGGIDILTSAVRNSGISLVIALLAVFVWTTISEHRLKTTTARGRFIVVLALSSAIYLPSPLLLSTIYASYLALWRISQFAEPVILLAVSAAACGFAGRISVRRRIILSLMLAIIVFSAIGNSRNDSDSPWIGSDVSRPRTYFSEADMNMIGLVKEISSETPAVADLPTYVYLEYMSTISVSPLILQTNGSVYFPQDSFIVLRYVEFSARGCILATKNAEGRWGEPTVGIIDNFSSLIQKSFIVYDNGIDSCMLTTQGIWIEISV